MKINSKNIEKKLKYTNDIFDILDWKDFLKNCNVEFYSSRKGRIWHSIRGKGFIIWISSFYPSKENGLIIWLSDIEINKNASEKGMETFNKFLIDAINRYKKLELIEMKSEE